jgi:predicted nucleic acid-binding protein
VKEIFADTAYWIALLNARDELHARAIASARNLKPYILVTSELVVVETLNHLSGMQSRAAAGLWADGLMNRRETRVIPVRTELLKQGLQLYRSRPDKAWSLTDCTSIVIMQRLGVAEVLTADRHFEQAGFEILLKR